MEARRCHNSATVGAPPRLPTEPFVRVFQPGLRMRWSSSMATTELGGTASAKKTKPNGDALVAHRATIPRRVSERKAYSQLAATVGPSRGFEITGFLVQRNHGCHVVAWENVGYNVSFFFPQCTTTRWPASTRAPAWTTGPTPHSFSVCNDANEPGCAANATATQCFAWRQGTSRRHR